MPVEEDYDARALALPVDDESARGELATQGHGLGVFGVGLPAGPEVGERLPGGRCVGQNQRRLLQADLQVVVVAAGDPQPGTQAGVGRQVDGNALWLDRWHVGSLSGTGGR